MSTTAKVHVGPALKQLAKLPPASAQTCVTSPPYWGLRDYNAGKHELGREKDPRDYLANLVAIFREVRRVLRPDGTLWLNMGDSYVSSGKGSSGLTSTLTNPKRHDESGYPGSSRKGFGLKRKQLVGMPWRLAFALQEDGWWLRQEVIWSKPNPMPEAIEDRPTRSHEQIFLLSVGPRYVYDKDAVMERCEPGAAHPRGDGLNPKALYVEPATSTACGKDYVRRKSGRSGLNERWKNGGSTRVRGEATARMGRGPGWRKQNADFSGAVNDVVQWRNARSVWTIPTQPYSGAHFACFPEELARRCILAGSRPGDVVLDPFAGTCTTGAVALKEGRSFVGVELNPEYAALGEKRMRVTLRLPFEMGVGT